MAEPTDQQKMAAAQKALAAMNPPRTEEDIAPNTLEAVVAVVWSQLALVEAPYSMPMFLEMVRPPTPVLEAKVKKYNADGVALAQECHDANVGKIAHGLLVREVEDKP